MSHEYPNPIDVWDRYNYSLVGAYEKIPEDAISHVVVNEEMADKVTDHNLKKWFDEDYLKERAGIFAFAKPRGSVYRIQTPSSHRSVYLQKDSFFTDEYGNGYGAISAKGTGLSYRSAPRSMGGDPIGFFGEYHAAAEEEVSERLAKEGARVGRVIGRIVFDYHKLQEWLGSVKGRGSYNPSCHLERVETNLDTPAILVRLEGSDRISDIDGSQFGVYTRPRVLGRAARLHLREIESRGGLKTYYEHYKIPEIPNLLENLSQLESSKKGNFYGFKDLLFLYFYFSEMNYISARRVSDKFYDGGLTFKNIDQDLDIAGFWYDFETSRPNTRQYKGDGRLDHNERPLPSFLTSNEMFGLRETASTLARANFE